MKQTTPTPLLPLLVLLLAGAASAAPAGDWPGWRGPTRDGRAAAGETPPVRWSETENVVWCVPVPGRGHSSPTLAGPWIFLSTAEDSAGEQRVLCFERASGRLRWNTVVHRGKLDGTLSRQSSHASPTVAWDGARAFVSFYIDGAVFTSALDPDGRLLWQRRVSPFVTIRGYGASPVVHQGVVIINADNKGGGKLMALDARTGEVRWELARPALQNYPSPTVMEFGGRAELIVAGCNVISSFDPLTGRRWWEFAGATETTVTTPLTDGKRIFITGGFPKNHVAAIAADGSGEVVWQSNTGVYVPSLVTHNGLLFAVLDTGRAVCWQADTGEELWREKVDREVYASPVVAGDRIYVSSLAGVTSVFAARADKFTLLAQNPLGDEAYASPAIAGNRLYLRHARKGDPRREFLWCIGN
jgi:outer membrane protein assembly factor BamB